MHSLERHAPSLPQRAGGVGLAAVGVWGTMSAGGSGFGAFLDVGALVLVGSAVSGLLLATFGLGGAGRAVAALARGGNDADLAHGTGFFLCAAALSLLAGGIGSLIGLQHVVQHLADPASIGASSASAMLSSLYGLMGAAGGIAAATAIARQEPTGAAVEATAGISLAMVAAGAVALFAVPAFVVAALTLG